MTHSHTAGGPPEPGAADLVVLLDGELRPAGTANRETVHSTETPLHLAYSCWLFDGDGNFLLTRRALGKRSWPGVWTNSFCGHPRPDEDLVDAVVRGARHELGARVASVSPLLPDFAYRAVDAAGIVENEFCPVFVARLEGDIDPHPDEVAEHHWVSLEHLRTSLEVAPWALSPWLREQAAHIDDIGWECLASYAHAQREGVAA